MLVAVESVSVVIVRSVLCLAGDAGASVMLLLLLPRKEMCQY